MNDEFSADGGPPQQHGNSHVGAVGQRDFSGKFNEAYGDFGFHHGAHFAVPAGAFHPPLALDRQFIVMLSAVVRKSKPHMAAPDGDVFRMKGGRTRPRINLGDQRAPAPASAKPPARASRSAEGDNRWVAKWAWLIVSLIKMGALLPQFHGLRNLDPEARKAYIMPVAR